MVSHEFYQDHFEKGNGDLEELHYLMVRVEKMKKKMLGNIEGNVDPNFMEIDLNTQQQIAKESEMMLMNDNLADNGEIDIHEQQVNPKESMVEQLDDSVEIQ